MTTARAEPSLGAALPRWGRVAAVAVFALALLNWAGWATRIDWMARQFPAWPVMTPWSALFLAALATAIAAQSGTPSSIRLWAGRVLAAVTGVLAVVFLFEYAIGGSFHLDQWWFSPAVSELQQTWPGRPSPQTASSILLISIAIGLIHLGQRWAAAVRLLSAAAAAAVASTAIGAYLFDADSLVGGTPPTRMAITSAIGVLLLTAATLMQRPEVYPLAWLLARPDTTTLVRMAAVMAGLPVLLGVSRLALLALGLDREAALVLAALTTTVVVGAATFYLSQREQRTLIEKVDLCTQRAEAQAHYHLLADNAVDIIVYLRDGEVVWISPSAEAALGWPVEYWVGTNFGAHIHPDDLVTAVTGIQRVDRGDTVTTRVRVRGKDAFHWVETRAKPYVDADGTADGVIANVRVVDEQVEAERQLTSDRRRFEAVARNAPSAISVRDLDNRYTMVNDAFCQLFGQPSAADLIGRTQDEVLPPEVLERSLRATPRLLAGEVFAEEESITRSLPNLNGGTDEAIVDEDILVMTQQFPLHDATGRVTELVSIRTDITHRRKAEQEALDRAVWEERIRAAISDGRILVFSQPVVEVTSGLTVEEELLVRLRVADNDRVLPPSEFLPQCERHGLMPLIDHYMVGRAIDLAGAGRRVCVNITGQTIGSSTAMTDILEALDAAGPHVTENIAFEITETTALASPEMAKAFSRGMSALGCRVALDDFGTGYGAFTELRHLDLDTLKIDLSFVRDMLEDREDELVVRTIIFVAQQYGLSTVAEGVESQAVLDRLAELGVDRAQGYFFGKPAPIDER